MRSTEEQPIASNPPMTHHSSNLVNLIIAPGRTDAVWFEITKSHLNFGASRLNLSCLNLLICIDVLTFTYFNILSTVCIWWDL